MKKYPCLDKAIANILNKLRIQKGMNKSNLADFSGLERCYLRDIEKGNRNPTLNTIFCLCEVLQIEPKDFVAMVQDEIKCIS